LVAGHIPVLFQETLRLLSPAPGEVFLDGTTGPGGHSEEIARRIAPGGILVCADADPGMLDVASARLRGFPGVTMVHADYSDFATLRDAAGGGRSTVARSGSPPPVGRPSWGSRSGSDGPLDMRRLRRTRPSRGTSFEGEEKELADLLPVRRRTVFPPHRESDRMLRTRSRSRGRRSWPPRNGRPKAWPRDIHPATRVPGPIAVNRELESLLPS
jgi:hypothetical protein